VKKWVGVTSFSSLFVFVCSDEEIAHEILTSMICDVHFGDTRYDLTPATSKWLPNDNTEEHTTTKTRTMTRTITATHYIALTQYTFALRNGWHYGTQVSRERERRWRGLVLLFWDVPMKR
jgi:hypothetical protein